MYAKPDSTRKTGHNRIHPDLGRNGLMPIAVRLTTSGGNNINSIRKQSNYTPLGTKALCQLRLANGNPRPKPKNDQSLAGYYALNTRGF